MLKIRRPRDRLIFNMETPIPEEKRGERGRDSTLCVSPNNVMCSVSRSLSMELRKNSSVYTSQPYCWWNTAYSYNNDGRELDGYLQWYSKVLIMAIAMEMEMIELP